MSLSLTLKKQNSEIMKFPPAFYSQLTPQADWQQLRDIAVRGGSVHLFFWAGRAQAQLDSEFVSIDFNCNDCNGEYPAVSQITEEQFIRMAHYFMSTRSAKLNKFHWEVRSQAEKNAKSRNKYRTRSTTVEEIWDDERAPEGIHSQGSSKSSKSSNGQSFSFENFQRALAKRAKLGE